jgi:hypothetical protein
MEDLPDDTRQSAAARTSRRAGLLASDARGSITQNRLTIPDS